MKASHLLIIISAIVLMLSAVAACAPAQPIANPTAEPATPAPTAALAGSISFETCTIGGMTAQCATYRVYENRAANSGRMIDLRIAVRPARSEPHEPDPFFYFAGGPGGSAIDALPGIAPVFNALNKTRDLVFIEQRGTGGSNKLMCPEPEDSLDINDAQAMKEYAESCLATLDADVGWYTTRAFVDDVDEIRQALGYDQINVVGGSYGATSAQVYLLQHEDHVRTMSMMGGTLLDFPIFERLAWSSQRALDIVFDRCEADATCHEAYPNINAEFESLLSQLDEQPVATSLIDPQTDEHLAVTPDVLTSVVHEMLMGADSAAQLPRLLHRAYTTDKWDSVAREYINRIASRNSKLAGLIMSAVIRCYEPWAVDSAEEIKRVSGDSYIKDAQVIGAENMAKVCAIVPEPEPEALYGPTQISTVPVLLLSGEEDPQNPPENVAAIGDVYPNSLVLFEPYRSHYTVRWNCISPIITEFIELGTTEGVQTTCLNTVEPFPFE